MAAFDISDPMSLAKYIDHTLLKPDATLSQVSVLCAEAKEYGFASVCVNPSFIKYVSDCLAGSGVAPCVVVGFPLGATPSSVKAFETAEVIRLGAKEVDMVINVGAAKAAGSDFVKTSTGFSTGGATIEDVKLMRETVGPEMGVKAAGGIRDIESAVAMLSAGASRLGTSAGVKIVTKA